jgi:hypothetical protein
VKRASANPCASKYYGCARVMSQDLISDPPSKNREMLDMLSGSQVKGAFAVRAQKSILSYENKIRVRFF